MVVQHAASVPSVPDADSAYWRFTEAVTRGRLLAWLPPGRRLLIDVSGPRADSAKVAAMAGHRVIRVIDEPPGEGIAADDTIVGDSATLDFLPDGCADGVIAGDRALSTHLAAESMVGSIARVLRPGGRVLASVDSLVLGMAMLAGQSRWAHLADLPQADVVLVPWPDGTITRCYAADQVRELFAGAGLAINWVRPLPVFSKNVVAYALRQAPGSMAKLVRAELSARPGMESPDESAGSALMVAAYKELPAAAGMLGLTVHAPAGGGLRLEPAVRDIVPAVHAAAVATCLDPVQCCEHPVPLHAGRVQHRLRPVVLGQVRSRVGGITGEPSGRLRPRPQVINRTVQLVAHLLEALTGDQVFHSGPRLPWAAV
jgi:hypothetical protein